MYASNDWCGSIVLPLDGAWRGYIVVSIGVHGCTIVFSLFQIVIKNRGGLLYQQFISRDDRTHRESDLDNEVYRFCEFRLQA